MSALLSLIYPIKNFISSDPREKINQIPRTVTQTIARFAPIFSVGYSAWKGNKLIQGSVLTGLGVVLFTPRSKKEGVEKTVTVAIYTMGLGLTTILHIQDLTEIVCSEKQCAPQATAIRMGGTALTVATTLVNLLRSIKYETENKKFTRSLAFLVPTMVCIGSSVILISSTAMRYLQEKELDPEDAKQTFQLIGVVSSLAGTLLAQKCTEGFMERSHLFKWIGVKG